jgi:hypothetical protein
MNKLPHLYSSDLASTLYGRVGFTIPRLTFNDLASVNYYLGLKVF